MDKIKRKNQIKREWEREKEVTFFVWENYA